MVAHGFEIPGPLLEAAAFGRDVVCPADGPAKFLPGDRPRNRRGGLGRIPPVERQAETSGQRGDGHGRGVGLALLGIARDVGRGEQCVFQQRRIRVRLVLPDVERPAETASEQSLAVDHLPARGVYEDGAGFHPAEQAAAGHVARRGVERRVEGEDVGLAGHLLQRPEPAPLALLARRVAADDAESPPFSIRFHERPDVPHAHDPQRAFGGLPSLRAGEVNECRADPLQHAPGIAARGRRDFDAVCRAPRRVDVVEADGRRGDQLYARIRQ